MRSDGREISSKKTPLLLKEGNPKGGVVIPLNDIKVRVNRNHPVTKRATPPPKGGELDLTRSGIFLSGQFQVAPDSSG